MNFKGRSDLFSYTYIDTETMTDNKIGDILESLSRRHIHRLLPRVSEALHVRTVGTVADQLWSILEVSHDYP